MSTKWIRTRSETRVSEVGVEVTLSTPRAPSGYRPLGVLTHNMGLPNNGTNSPGWEAVTTLELDDRRRAPLARIARPEDSTFLAEVLPDGRIILTPAVTLSKSQAVLNSRPDILDAIDRSYAGETVSGTRPARRRTATAAKPSKRSRGR